MPETPTTSTPTCSHSRRTGKRSPVGGTPFVLVPLPEEEPFLRGMCGDRWRPKLVSSSKGGRHANCAFLPHRVYALPGLRRALPVGALTDVPVRSRGAGRHGRDERACPRQLSVRPHGRRPRLRGAGGR